MKTAKPVLWSMCVLLFSAAAMAGPATDSGTYFVVDGNPQVNENLIRFGHHRNGQIEFTGIAIFDMSGYSTGELQSEGVSLSGNLKVFSGKPAGLTVEYLGTSAAGELTVQSGRQWNAAPAMVSLPLSPKANHFAANIKLPADSLTNRYAVFRFKNETLASQWDLSSPVLTLAGRVTLPSAQEPSAASNDSGDTAALYRKTIPTEKQLDPEWVESLTQRGHRADAAIRGSKEEDSLKYIGMPVGGIACGSLVIDGAGQLYVWDIFGAQPMGLVKQDVELPEGYIGFKNGLRKTIRVHDGANFMNPPTVEKFPPPVKSGFALKLTGGAEYQLGSDDWDTVEFEGQWPVGNVSFTDSASPVSVELKAFSPFIPLNVEDSKLPATVMAYTLINESSKSVSIEFDGWLGVPERDAKLQTESIDGATGFSLSLPKAGKNKAGTLGLTVVSDAMPIMRDGINGLRVSVELAPGERRDIPFLITWHFGHDAYSKKFSDAAEVADYVVGEFERLSSHTHLWADTWNDTTLPQWFIDRAMAPASTMQTANLQFAGDRFWAWEGIGAGAGTCTHVWAYAQAMARLFPSLERNLREVTDFEKYQLPDGGVPFRPSKSNAIAIDGQCGTVLRSYREHQMSADDRFLKRNWPSIKKALNYLIEFDKNDDAYDGLLDGMQHNTLDAEWYGKVHVLCSLYLAALRAGEEMAAVTGDSEFEKLCRDTYAMGSRNIEKLYNGEYYVQIEDPNHADAIGVGPGVYIDQVYGQFWANQVGLGRLYNEQHIRSALNAIWKYNYVTDVGQFREVFRKGRFYAWKGDAGVIMCSWPNGGINEKQRDFWTYGYFNEVMSGFEHQLAAHMIAERDPELLTKGLAIMRTIHDRYAPAKRNPYNEIEFSDFYARAMASYGSFLAACGFEYNGPAGTIGFAPVIHPENFRAPFTAAEGWGTFSQKIDENSMKAAISVNWGSVKLQSIKLNPGNLKAETVAVTLNGESLKAKLVKNDENTAIELDTPATIDAGNALSIELR
ncbi:GH116 family glycosyl hydrolase [Aporhodopirellula aestuarii]|uniref:Non-lysosomal glucosylceramidase n=1 Tax=Aporhodopirellula aestuarii TaxID=2950107 RepID=A0ABT0UE78_9BACT|nr:GH116 family glycosyl hydrolase [Aporhodopirellula aestuarii]MCM2375194.1 non-lysosomal glucosylceramidase [Aporhodopirellula aestuarii]